MFELLSPLLADSLKRARFLSRRMESRRDSLPGCLNGFYERNFDRLSRLITLFEGLENDPDLRNPTVQRNIFWEYRQARQMIDLIEDCAVVVIERFNDEDEYMTSIANRICQEIEYPLNHPVCSSLSLMQYYGAFLPLDLIVVPTFEAHHLTSLPDLYHEVAHFVVEHDRKGLESRIHPRICAAFDDLYAMAQKKNLATATVEQIKNHRKAWLGLWLDEFACDALAAYWCGPAYGWANLKLCAHRSDNLFSGYDSHPPDHARTQLIFEVMRQLGWLDSVEAIDHSWKQLQTFLGPAVPLDFEWKFPSALIRDFSSEMIAWAKSLKLNPYQSEKSDETVAFLLNDAWRNLRDRPSHWNGAEENLNLRLATLVQS